MKLDSSQAAAVHVRDGPAMVLAGPGSGKTTVITHRVEYLIRVRHVDPSRILVITFSRAAAREMRERFLVLSDHHLLPVTFGTFHAIFFQILQHAYGYQTGQVVREDARVDFMRDYIHRLRLECNDEAELIQGLFSEISRAKSAGTDPSVCSESAVGDLFPTVYRAYEEFLRQNRYLDFDDMLVRTKSLLSERPDILAAWQQRFSHILVDEFQDINPIQYDVVRMLARPEDNLFIVGDDDQSIYRFRGAHPEIMLHFPEDYPNAQRILLDVNYRSGPAIVAAAGRLIGHNAARYEKPIRAGQASSLPPHIQAFPTQREENDCVCQTIQTLHAREGVPYEEMAVLTRTHAQATLLTHQLAEQNLPFLSSTHLPSLYEHWITQDLITYLRLADGERTRAAFLRVMNRPNRHLTRESLPYENVDFSLWQAYYAEDPQMRERLMRLEADLTLLSDMRPYAAINYIRHAVGYEGYLAECALSRHLPVEELQNVLEDLQEDARSFDTSAAWWKHVEQGAAEWAKHQRAAETPAEAVRVMTLHAAKGLEFDTVFLVDVDETIMPYKKALLAEEIEEERRLFYVGMTRAKRRLYLFSSAQIRNKTMAPSRFLAECAQPMPDKRKKRGV